MTTGSGTGKRATAGASVPASELVARLRRCWGTRPLRHGAMTNVGDSQRGGGGVFGSSAAQGRGAVTAIAGARRYGLPVDTAIVTGAVVGPDEASPVRLLRLGEANGHFRGGAVYDVAWSDDAATPPVLVLGREWPAGTVLAVRLLRPQTQPVADDGRQRARRPPSCAAGLRAVCRRPALAAAGAG